MKKIAKLLPRIDKPEGARQPSSDSISPEATLPAPLSANSAVTRAEAHLAPASAKEMALALNELLSVYGVPAGWDTGASVYRRLWAHLPGDVLRDAIDRYMATDTEWFPKPGQILALAEHEMVWRRKDLDRAGGGGAPAVPVPAPVARRITAEEATNAVEVFWKLRGGRFVGLTAEPATTVEPRYQEFTVPETIAGKPWRSDG